VGLRVTQFLAVMLASLTPITARTKNQIGNGKALFVMSGAGGEDGFVRCLYNTTAETFRLSSSPLRIHHDYRAAHSGQKGPIRMDDPA
jgi:hypothetical protein